MLHPRQAAIRDEAARFNVLACGRRFGKTTLGQRIACEAAIAGLPVAWFSPTYKLLDAVWQDFKDLLAPVVRSKGEQLHILTLEGGGSIEMWSLDDEDPARGRKYGRVVVDEAAMVRGLGSRWQNAIRPTLTDLIGDAWFLSTPKGLNEFFYLYERGQDPKQADWKSWRSPTTDNPYISAQEIEDACRDLPEQVFSQEYLAEFLADGTGVFRGVQAALTAERQEARTDGHTYVVGADWGKINDFTVYSVFDCTTQRQAYLDRTNRIDYVVQSERLAALCDEFKPTAVLCERNAMGDPIFEQLLRLGLPVQGFDTTNASKADLIDNLALRIERGQIALLDDPVQTAELLAYAGTRLPGGLVRYSAPSGMHDDTVIALALAVRAGGRLRARTATPYSLSAGRAAAEDARPALFR